MTSFLYTGPADAKATLLLAHGAGAAMDSAWMTDFADRLAAEGLRCARFEFSYMAGRRDGQRKPPPKAEKLIDEFLAAVDAVKPAGSLFVGGKSMGGRVASLVAGDLHRAKRIAGLVCLGYPFHPPGQPEKLRTAHLSDLKTPTLICHGTRDPFASRDEVETYGLSKAIEMFWLEDGDHDFRPRKAVSGLTMTDNMSAAVARVVAFMR